MDFILISLNISGNALSALNAGSSCFESQYSISFSELLSQRASDDEMKVNCTINTDHFRADNLNHHVIKYIRIFFLRNLPFLKLSDFAYLKFPRSHDGLLDWTDRGLPSPTFHTPSGSNYRFQGMKQNKQTFSYAEFSQYSSSYW